MFRFRGFLLCFGGGDRGAVVINQYSKVWIFLLRSRLTCAENRMSWRGDSEGPLVGAGRAQQEGRGRGQRTVCAVIALFGGNRWWWW